MKKERILNIGRVALLFLVENKDYHTVEIKNKLYSYNKLFFKLYWRYERLAGLNYFFWRIRLGFYIYKIENKYFFDCLKYAMTADWLDYYYNEYSPKEAFMEDCSYRV